MQRKNKENQFGIESTNLSNAAEQDPIQTWRCDFKCALNHLCMLNSKNFMLIVLRSEIPFVTYGGELWNEHVSRFMFEPWSTWRSKPKSFNFDLWRKEWQERVAHFEIYNKIKISSNLSILICQQGCTSLVCSTRVQRGVLLQWKMSRPKRR